MMSDVQLKTLIAVILVAFAIVVMAQGNPVPSSVIYNSFSYVVSAVAIVLLLWDRHLWHLWPFYPNLHTRPDLGGTWKGELISNYSERQGQPIEVYLVIRQTYSTINLRLLSAESSSASLSGNFFSDCVGLYTIASTYRNIPAVLRREKSPINHGGLLLSVRGKPVHQLDGEYWTDRGTKGEIELTSRSKKHAEDFRQAQGLRFERHLS